MAVNEEQLLNTWKEQQGYAERMMPLIGQLFRDKGVILEIFGRSLIHATTINIIKAHRFARQVSGYELSLANSYNLVERLMTMDIKACKIDLGKLNQQHVEVSDGATTDQYLAKSLASAIGQESQSSGPKDVVLFGFGRIGRLLARLLIERTGSGTQMRLRAIVVRGKCDLKDLQKRASLLRRDSVHGQFNGTVVIDEENKALIANGNYIHIIPSLDPEEIDYQKYGINDALLVDNTGIFKDEAGLSRHLQAKGISKVLLTAPAKGAIKNIVYGVNDQSIKDTDTILSAASCTTNAITPVLKAINDRFVVVNGHMETVHAYTNDQNLIDNYHPASRRGRSAPLNMVLTETGAASAVAKALPELEGKLTGNAIRVPTPNVSMAVLNLNLENATTKDELNDYLRDIALHSSLQDQLDYTASTELVSSDLVGSRHAGVIDSETTIAKDNRCVVYVWYDNEFGYSCQVIRMMQKMSGFEYVNLP